jgi:hypothetical protein
MYPVVKVIVMTYVCACLTAAKHVAYVVGMKGILLFIIFVGSMPSFLTYKSQAMQFGRFYTTALPCFHS